jgi:hypothetical protein
MNIALLTLTVIAAAATATARCVNQAGAYPAAGGLAFGVTRCAGEAGDALPVDVMGTTIAEAGGAFDTDVALMVDATGKVVLHDGAAGKFSVGRSMAASLADGDLVEILLVPNAGDADAVV